MTDLQTVLAIPVSTTNDVPGRTLASYVGPAFGLVVRSTGAGGNLMGTVKGMKKGQTQGLAEILAYGMAVTLA